MGLEGLETAGRPPVILLPTPNASARGEEFEGPWPEIPARSPCVAGVIPVIYYSVLLSLGLPVNLVTTVALARLAARTRKPSYQYLLALTASDIVTQVVIVTRKPSYQYLLALTASDIVTQVVIVFVGFLLQGAVLARQVPRAVVRTANVLEFAANHASVWVAVLLTVDRYKALCHPLHHRATSSPGQTRRAIAVMLSAALLTGVPFYWWPDVWRDADPPSALDEALKWAHCLLVYFGPLGIFLAANSAIIFRLRKRGRSGLRPAVGKSTAILLGVTSLFSLLWAPRVVVILYHLYVAPVHRDWRVHLALDVANMVAMLNTVVNVGLCCLVSKTFWATVQQALSARKPLAAPWLLSPQLLGIPPSKEVGALAASPRDGGKGCIDDVFGDLLGDDTTSPEKPVEPAPYNRDARDVPQKLPSSKARGRSFWEDEIFDTSGGLAGADTEASDISDANPQALLQAIKDLDDMDADLLGLKKSPASDRRVAKGSGREELPLHPEPAGKLTASEKDLEEPLAGLLSDDEEGIARKLPVTESKTTCNKTPSTVRGPGPSIPLTPGDTPIRKKELLFDDGDDIMATLRFGDSPTAERRQMGDQEGPRLARSKLDELLGRGTATKLLARPGTGEHREFKLDKKFQRSQDKEDPWDDEILTFGAYQPTLGSSEGRQARRQSVRFLAEGGPDPKGEPGSKWSPPMAASPIHPRKGGADWLGLKDEDLDLLPPSPTHEPQGGGPAISTSSIPPSVSQHSAPSLHSTPAGLPSSGAKLPAEGAMSPAKSSQAAQLRASREKEEEGDWLSHVLSQKKSQGLAREEHTGAYKTLNLAGSAPSGSPLPGFRGLSRQLLEGPQEEQEHKKHWLPGLTLRGLTLWEPTTCFLSSQEPTGLPVPVQSLVSQSLVQNPLPGTGYQKPLLASQAQLQSSAAQLQAELLQCQAQLAELEAQVRKLELERTQHRLLLESLQQRHQADLELIESAHRQRCPFSRSRIKVLETSYQQREERLRRENEELSAQYLSHCQEAEQARAELTAQHQRRLAVAEQEKDQEMERLRELQRASILEMRKDHEEQLQRLKLLKDREIDAVTSATSHTRSLNGIIEQMEKFSSSLNELASRVEASRLTTSQERELGVRQWDGQLRVLQERLGQQQRDMEEERGRLQEVIGKMEARLSEQSRLLEQERWRVTAEQSKAESMQRALEEQRRVMLQQIAMERGELERAKSALLEEQKSVMQKCGEERRRLAMEWAEFSTQQKLSKERAEREAERALQVDTQREGTIISLAKEQAELKVRASEFRAKEEQLATERDAVERERQELRLEKQKVEATARSLQLQAKEVEHMSKVASKKYEEGEQALCKARQVQSEQQARLQGVQRQQEWLRQQEKHMYQAGLLPSPPPPRAQLPPSLLSPVWGWEQENLSLAQQRLQLDHVRQDLPCCHPELPPRARGPAPSSLHAASAFVVPIPTSHQHSQLLTGPDPAQFLTELVLLKHSAEQDRDFLENEAFFLKALKKAPYNLPFHSA
ncbi:Fas-binding factor 1 [Fukomys damarensis]|uniref:Fas-binding factor 1 n=1 Tax=Fukomys damarensis TaxID=885580 RepID=A0A091DX31_FUKDA|nr:Fas-binding factor 1 [Fukomys damarensis]